MDTDIIFEIRDTDINVEEIREKIKKSLERRIESGTYPTDPELIEKKILPQNNEIILTGMDIERDFKYINTCWDINNTSYRIKSHHPYIGKVLVRGRELVNQEVRRYVDPMVTRQSEFNASTTRILNENLNQFTALHDHIEIHDASINQQEKKIETILDRMHADLKQALENIQVNNKKSISDLKHEIITRIQEDGERTVSNLKHEIDLKIQNDIDTQKNFMTDFIESHVQQRIKNAMMGLESDIRSKIWLEKILASSISNPRTENQGDSDFITIQSQDYFQFNEMIGKAWVRESGESSDSPNVFEDAANIFSSCQNVLDIGCGQGYFLSVLKSRNIGSYGIDINQIFSSYCQQQGLNVLTTDAITHLENIDDESLDGIFISQLIEHLSTDSIFSLITHSYQKMKKGSYIVIITPNILSVQVSSNLFYMDPSHKTHVHPEVLKYILHYCGFSDIQEKFYNTVPIGHKLQMIDEKDIEENSRQLCELVNYNFEFLNKFLFGYRDYAVIVKK